MKKQNIKFEKIYSDGSDSKDKLFEVYEYILNQLKIENKIS